MTTFMPMLSPFPDSADAIFFMLLYLSGAFVFLTACTIVFESATLQLLEWGNFRRCLSTSFWMNLVSFVIGYIFFNVSDTDYLNSHLFVLLLITFPLSILTEWGVLEFRNWTADISGTGKHWQNLRASIIANLVSYVLLVLPASLWITNL